MNRQFHNMRQSLMFTDKQAGVADYSTNQKNFTGHMFNIKLEEKSYKMSFKALPVNIQRSKTARGGGAQCAPKRLIGLRNALQISLLISSEFN